MAFSRLQRAQTDDQEVLSAYLDNQLSVAERISLERRLQADQRLRAELQELRAVKTLLGDLQPVMPPRSFTLDPATVRRPASLPLFNLLRLGSALATVLLVLTFAVDSIGTSTRANPVTTAAQAPASAQAPAAPSVGTFSAPAASAGGQSTTGAGAAALSAPTQPAPALQAPAAAADQSNPSARQSKIQPSPVISASTQADASEPPEVVQPGQVHASDSSSPGTGKSALPSETQTAAPSSTSSSILMRWVQVLLGIVALVLALGAWVIGRQRYY